MTDGEVTRKLLALGDLDELVRHAERLAEAADWDELLAVRDGSRDALQRGHQLWPAAARAEYLLALGAPAPIAARMLVEGTGRFSLGPLSEVAASTHTWAELGPHVVAGAPEAAMAAHERVVRGEDLHDDRRLDPFLLEVPLRLSPWEPAYPLAEYLPHEARFPVPEVTGFEDAAPGGRSRPADDPETVRALLDLATGWTSGSSGRAEAAAVRGDAPAAVAALGGAGAGAKPLRLAPLTPKEALARLAWTAASGGAHGRRRGMAAGRYAAWWAAAALTGMADDFPPDAAELGDAIAELQWWAWDRGAPDTGWVCRLAVEDPAEGVAWALDATDELPT